MKLSTNARLAKSGFQQLGPGASLNIYQLITYSTRAGTTLIPKDVERLL